MKFLKLHYLILFVLINCVLLNSCEDKLDITAPPKDITAVYGLLNQKDTIHFFRINKAFLVEGDANNAAKKRELMEYNNLEAFVEQWKDTTNKKPTNVYRLKDTVLSTKKEGAFYSPEHTLYYFKEPDLNEESVYKLKIKIKEGDEVKKLVKGETVLTKNFNIRVPLPNSHFDDLSTDPPGLKLYANGDYMPERVTWTSSKNTRLYDLSARLHFLEVRNSGEETMKSIQWKIEQRETNTLDGGEKIKVKINGRSFYQNIKNNIEKDPNVEKRKFKGVDLVFAAANDELATFLEVSKPTTSIITEKPSYTNLDTAAEGIFAARFSKTIKNLWLNWQTSASMTHLFKGKFTKDLKFCTDSINAVDGDQDSPYYCP